MLMKLIIEEFTFRGLLGRTNITLNKTTQVWEILSHTSAEHLFGSYNGSKHFPLGLQSWSMLVDCNVKKASKEMKLKLSKVLKKC
jgi:hypothetical protein